MTEIQWIIWLDTHVAWSSFLQEMMTINTSLLINLWFMLLAGVTSTVLAENQYSSSFQCSVCYVPVWVSILLMYCHLCFTSSSNWWITNFSPNTTCIRISHALATWRILLENPSLWKIIPISFICNILSNLPVTEIWILLFWTGCDSWGVIYWYKLKGPISYTIRLCERNMHLLILKCAGFRGQGEFWAAWWARCQNTPVPCMCASCPQPATKQPPPSEVHCKIQLCQPALHHLLSELSFVFPSLRQAGKILSGCLQISRYKVSLQGFSSAMVYCSLPSLAVWAGVGWSEWDRNKTGNFSRIIKY